MRLCALCIEDVQRRFGTSVMHFCHSQLQPLVACNSHIARDDAVSVQIRRISVIGGLSGTGKRILSNSSTTDDADLTDSHGFIPY